MHRKPRQLSMGLQISCHRSYNLSFNDILNLLENCLRHGQPWSSSARFAIYVDDGRQCRQQLMKQLQKSCGVQWSGSQSKTKGSEVGLPMLLPMLLPMMLKLRWQMAQVTTSGFRCLADRQFVYAHYGMSRSTQTGVV